MAGTRKSGSAWRRFRSLRHIGSLKRPGITGERLLTFAVAVVGAVLAGAGIKWGLPIWAWVVIAVATVAAVAGLLWPEPALPPPPPTSPSQGPSARELTQTLDDYHKWLEQPGADPEPGAGR